jgi:hypothetical protein
LPELGGDGRIEAGRRRQVVEPVAGIAVLGLDRLQALAQLGVEVGAVGITRPRSTGLAAKRSHTLSEGTLRRANCLTPSFILARKASSVISERAVPMIANGSGSVRAE